jgi:hypothetical protein
MNVRRKLGKLREMTRLFVFGLPKFAIGSIDVTNRCNLRCEHCYFFAEDHDNERELSIEKWVEKLEAMKAAGHLMMLWTISSRRNYFRLLHAGNGTRRSVVARLAGTRSLDRSYSSFEKEVPRNHQHARLNPRADEV